MNVLEIEKLNQLVSRTDMSGNQKVEWLVNFIEKREQALSQHDVSRRSELLFAFITEIKSEFADQNWDYLDFIAERVIGKQ
jgi:hypothetical protein